VDNQKTLYELEQETIILQDLLEREKLNKAEELLAHRLVFAAIIFVILLFILIIKLEYASRGVQWLCFILFFGAALVVLGLIGRSYNREKDDARKAINNLKELFQQKRYDHYSILRTFGETE
jgi:predicted membrane channel-forming protein YqfA (hemolysin III family)